MGRNKTFRVCHSLLHLRTIHSSSSYSSTSAPAVAVAVAKSNHRVVRTAQGKRTQNGSRNQQQQQRAAAEQKGQRGNYDSIPSENALYEKFYRESGLIPEEEWEEFWKALKRTLPTTFRFTGSKG